MVIGMSTLFEKFGKLNFFSLLASFLVEDFCFHFLAFVLGVTCTLGSNQLLPFFGIVGFHPCRNLQETCIIIANEDAFLTSPAKIGNRSNFVHTWAHIIVVIYLEIVDGISHENFEPFIKFLTGFDLEDEIEIGSQFALLGIEWYIILLELIMAKFPQLPQSAQNRRIKIRQSRLRANGRIAVKGGLARVEPELGAHNLELFLGLQGILPDLEPIPVQEKYIPQFDIVWEILDMLGVEEDVAWVTCGAGVDDLQFQAVIFFGVFAMGVRTIHDNADCVKLATLARGLALDFGELRQAVLLVHNLFKYNGGQLGALWNSIYTIYTVNVINF